MKRILSLIIIGLLGLSAFSTLAPQIKAQNEPLDTIIVDSDGLTYYSTISLEAGVTYTIEASGTYIWGGPEEQNQGDAKYYTTEGWETYHVNDWHACKEAPETLC